MYSADSLEHAFGLLYRSGIRDGGYSEAEVEELLEGLDFHCLVQVVRHHMASPYAFATQGRLPKSFNYRSRELFGQKAALLYDDLDQCSADVVLAARTMELWLLEDMTFVAVACVTVDHTEGEYTCEYREAKGDPWECGMCLDLEELTACLDRMSWAAYENETPVYEL